MEINIDILSKDPVYLEKHKDEIFAKTKLRVFKEAFGNCNVLLYDPELFTEEIDSEGNAYLYYRGSAKDFKLPNGASTIHRMFAKYAYIPAEADLTGVIDASEAFYENCSALTIDISNWKTKDLKCVSRMFFGSMFSEIKIGDMTNVEDMSGMFSNCYLLTNLNYNFGKIYNLMNCNRMLAYCENVTDFTLSLLSDNMPSMDDIFIGCYKLNSVDFRELHFTNLNSVNAADFGLENDVSIKTNFLGKRLFENSNVKYEVFGE